MTTALDVWLRGERVGVLRSMRGGFQFVYDRSVLERVGLGRPLLSTSLVTSVRAFPYRVARPFFDGLLPEGEARRIIAFDFGLAESDTFALLREIGGECPGAVAILPVSAHDPPTPTIGAARPISPSELVERLAQLRFHPLGVDREVRVSLAGMQEKLLVAQMPEGWGLPTAGSASTHIMKPELREFPGWTANEALCLAFARRLGVHAAAARVEVFDDRPTLVVERFDRLINSNGTVTRLHQEDLCQALGIPVTGLGRKYEANGGPSLLVAARLLSRWSTPDAVRELLRQVTVNVMVGNADAHSMNTSLVHREGHVSIAPMYDIIATFAYARLSTECGMFVNGKRQIDQVTLDDVIEEATNWGVDRTHAARTVADLRRAAPAALRDAIVEVPQTPKNLRSLLRDRIRSL
jgi:serine/threonine-protein kinase HipA